MRAGIVTALISLAFASAASADSLPPYTRGMQAGAALAAPVESLLGDQFADQWYVPSTDRFEIGIAPSTPVDELRALVDRSGFADVVDLVPVPYTDKQLFDGLDRLNPVVWPLIGQAKVQTGLALNDQGIPSVVVWWANNTTEADQGLIQQGVEAAGVAVQVTHIDRPDLSIIATDALMPAPKAKAKPKPKPKPKPKKHRRHRRHKHHAAHRSA